MTQSIKSFNCLLAIYDNNNNNNNNNDDNNNNNIYNKIMVQKIKLDYTRSLSHSVNLESIIVDIITKKKENKTDIYWI